MAEAPPQQRGPARVRRRAPRRASTTSGQALQRQCSVSPLPASSRPARLSPPRVPVTSSSAPFLATQRATGEPGSAKPAMLRHKVIGKNWKLSPAQFDALCVEERCEACARAEVGGCGSVDLRRAASLLAMDGWLGLELRSRMDRGRPQKKMGSGTACRTGIHRPPPTLSSGRAKPCWVAKSRR